MRAKTVATRPLLTAGVLALALSGATACTSDAGRSQTEPGSGAATASGAIIQPGRPGEEAQTLAPDASVAGSDVNEVDLEFVQMMIPHHAQAMEMGELAESRAHDEQVRSMARRIADAQRAEIVGMAGWLSSRGLEVPRVEDLQGHDRANAHGGHGEAEPMMPGMLSPAEMEQLGAAEGRRFDELYLRGMIRHHQGALDMAGTAMDGGSDTVVAELAADISVGQAAEITRLRYLLRGLAQNR